MTIEDRDDLLRNSMEDPNNSARRYALRRGRVLEWFEGKLTEVQGNEPVFHGHPTRRVPARVLRIFRNAGTISDAEYRQMVKELGA